MDSRVLTLTTCPSSIQDRFYFNNVIPCLISVSKIMNLLSVTDNELPMAGKE